MTFKKFFSRGLLVGAASVALSLGAQADFAEATKGLEFKGGLVDTYVDHAKARVLLALDKPDENGIAGRYIYAAYLTGGLGSNPVGLDRSVPAGGEIISFRRMGGKVVAMVENHNFRATTDNTAEKRAVETSFAQSIIWSGDIMEEDEGTGRLLVDFSPFLTRDAVGVGARLKAVGEGSFSLVKDHSLVDTKAAFMFPENGEFDAYVTFASDKPGREVRQTTPIPEAVTLIAHTTLIKLPDAGYETRLYDDRAALIGMTYVDMSAPLAGDTVVRLARRFRLEKDESGNVINPIIFYIDNGAPEPIRSALQEGANWWADAFAAAGYPGGYKAEILPEGVHPLDARYNVVNWVHRATRGWSYGAAVADPRTGEVLRGVVLLGSLRVRQDIKIFEALSGASKTGTGAADDPVELALSRIRQLAAHEVGHALGFAHNMGASTYDDRASVMDYPAPDVRANEDGTLDFSHAYGVGIGTWDKWTARFLYGDYGDMPEAAAQAALIREADDYGHLFVSDPDSRSISSGHARGAVWDTGADPLASLANTMKVRRIALDRFGMDNLRDGENVTALQSKFVPLYLYHRYQLAAAAKSLGGMDFVYRHEGDGRPAPAVVPWERQEKALSLLLETVSPAALDVKGDVLATLSPLGYSDGDPQFGREVFDNTSRPMFDHMAAAASAASLSFDALLNPARLARVATQGDANDGYPGLATVLRVATDKVMAFSKDENKTRAGLRELVANLYAERLIGLVLGEDVPVAVRQDSRVALADVKARAEKLRRSYGAFASALTARIDDALARARTPAINAPAAATVPPGSPIGSELGEACWHCDELD
ncbi:zinc-dependent metalloprotease [Kordiimonas aestuarii]|uniref:zinc-dependent metalloprotease n=1 Tax=Kordiimonas aestuarii TaxID=1005925 RepID=UPI0021D2E8C5|nr:zinc-dependent metalloprotease [Kordiimonas aestuarii]